MADDEEISDKPVTRLDLAEVILALRRMNFAMQRTIASLAMGERPGREHIKAMTDADDKLDQIFTRVTGLGQDAE